MRKATGTALAAVLLLVPAPAAPVPGADPAGPLARIRAVRGEGEGNPEARRAWSELVAIGPRALLPTLRAMDGASPLAANWLRAAADAIAEKAFRDRTLSARDLEGFVLDRRHHGPARRIAYDWLVRLDASAPKRLVPGMIDDPGAELRRDAVAAAVERAEALAKKGDRREATAAYRRAFDAARDADQVEAAAKRLKELGIEVDLAAHYGHVRRWMLAAPFDNAGGVGYAAAYPPEQGVDLTKTYPGKKETAARWVEYVTKDPRGLIDLNAVLGKQKGVVAYAYAVVDSPRAQRVQVRAGCITAIRIFLNGKEVFHRDEYHHGMDMDQHVAAATLKAGRNEILVKVCQNEQTEVWAQDWKLQLRLCDDIGGAVPFREARGGEGRSENDKGGR